MSEKSFVCMQVQKQTKIPKSTHLADLYILLSFYSVSFTSFISFFFFFVLFCFYFVIVKKCMTSSADKDAHLTAMLRVKYTFVE